MRDLNKMALPYTVQFAPVAPIHILEKLQGQDRSLFGPYHLFLAHHTVEFPERFHELVKKQLMEDRYNSMTIIMDNSIVELGGAVDDDMIAQAVETVLCDGGMRTSIIPCLPDVMGSGAGTLELSLPAYERWDARGMDGDGYMVVTQGENWLDFTRTVDELFVHRSLPNIRWVGIPRKLVGALGTRSRAVQYIQMVAPNVNIHLLGFSEHIADDLFCARMQGIRGIDSAVPVRYNNLLTPMTEEAHIGPRGNWWEAGKVHPTNVANIRNVRQWIRSR